MGRHPLMAAVNRYLERRELQVGKRTLANDARILRNIARVMEAKREAGEIATTNPNLISEREIRAFVDWMCDPREHQGRVLDPDTQVRYLRRLEEVLKQNGNDVVSRMRLGGYKLPMKAAPKPIRAIKEDDLEIIQTASLKVPGSTGEPSSWRPAKARFLMCIYVATGLRPSELRLARIVDLNTTKWKINVRHPKGEGRWTSGRTVTIMPPYRDEVRRFLAERDNLLRYHGRAEAEYLVPNLRGGGDTYYSANHFRKLKKQVEEAAGVEFKLKDFRPTFASMTVEMDPNLLVDVSAMLGHSNLNTTQRYYAQISADSAGSRLEKAWERAKPVEENPMSKLLETYGFTSLAELEEHLSGEAEKPRKPGIDFQNPMSGYF